MTRRAGLAAAGGARGLKLALFATAALLLAAAFGAWLLAPRTDERTPARPPEVVSPESPDLERAFRGDAWMPDALDREPLALDAPSPAQPAAPVPPYVDVEVANAEGRPVRGARVSLPGRLGFTAITDEAGRARLAGDPFADGASGDVRVTAAALCYRPATARLARSAVVQAVVQTSLLDRSPPPAPTPTRLVLRRCTALQLVLAAGADVDGGELLIRLRADGPLFEPGLWPGTSGAIGGKRPQSSSWRPALDGAEPAAGDAAAQRAARDKDRRGAQQRMAALLKLASGQRDGSSGAGALREGDTFFAGVPRNEEEVPVASVSGDERLYDFSTDGTRLIVGLQPGQLVHVVVAGRYGEALFERDVRLGAEEWLRLETPVSAPSRELAVVVRAAEGARRMAVVELVVDDPAFVPMGDMGNLVEVPGTRTFRNLRADRVTVAVHAPGLAAQEHAGVPLSPGANTLQVLLELEAAPPPSR